MYILCRLSLCYKYALSDYYRHIIVLRHCILHNSACIEEENARYESRFHVPNNGVDTCMSTVFIVCSYKSKATITNT